MVREGLVPDCAPESERDFDVVLFIRFEQPY